MASESVQKNTDIAVATREECRERIQNAGSRVVAKGLEHALKTKDGDQILKDAAKIKLLVEAGGKAAGFGEEQTANMVVSLNFLKELPDEAAARVFELPPMEEVGHPASEGDAEGEVLDEGPE